MSDIGYPIKSDRQTTSDKLYITQLLPTEYSIKITNRFGGYQYNKQCRLIGIEYSVVILIRWAHSDLIFNAHLDRLG